MDMLFEIDELAINDQPQEGIKFNTLSDARVKNKGAILNYDGKGCVKIKATYKGILTWKEDVHVLVTAFHKTNVDTYIPSRFSVQRCGSPPDGKKWNLFTDLMQRKNNQFTYVLENACIFSPFKTKFFAKDNPELSEENCFKSYLKAYLEYDGVSFALMSKDMESVWKESSKNIYANSICLKFELFSIDASQKKEIVSAPLYTNAIYNGSKFEIIRMCNTHVPHDGKSYMTLLLSELESLRITLAAHDDESKKIIKWKTNNPTYEKHRKNIAITFQAPAVELNAEINPLLVKCRVQIELDEKKSAPRTMQPQTFYYVNVNFEENLRAKRKAEDKSNDFDPFDKDDDEDVDEDSSITKTITNIKRHRSNITSSTIGQYDMACKTNFGQSMFDMALKLGRLSEFLNLNLSVLEKYMANWVNEMNQSLLHRACELNQHLVIPDLVRIGCPTASPCVRTYETPLHIALDRGHQECVEAFFKLLNKSEKKLIPLMLHHDYLGYTVAHVAAATGNLLLLKAILNFCKKVNIDVLEMRTLSLDYTLMDLAKKYYHEEIELLLLEAFEELAGNDDDDDDDDDDDSHIKVSYLRNALESTQFMPMMIHPSVRA